jgi:hypothetical protein
MVGPIIFIKSYSYIGMSEDLYYTISFFGQPVYPSIESHTKYIVYTYWFCECFIEYNLKLGILICDNCNLDSIHFNK